MCIETCRYVHTPTDKDGSAWLLTLECAYSVYFEFGSFFQASNPEFLFVCFGVLFLRQGFIGFQFM